MKREQYDYLSYLLRLWPVGVKDGKYIWRGSLENIHTGERKGISSLEDLYIFLQQQTDAADAGE